MATRTEPYFTVTLRTAADPGLVGVLEWDYRLGVEAAPQVGSTGLTHEMVDPAIETVGATLRALCYPEASPEMAHVEGATAGVDNAARQRIAQLLTRPDFWLVSNLREGYALGQHDDFKVALRVLPPQERALLWFEGVEEEEEEEEEERDAHQLPPIKLPMLIVGGLWKGKNLVNGMVMMVPGGVPPLTPLDTRTPVFPWNWGNVNPDAGNVCGGSTTPPQWGADGATSVGSWFLGTQFNGHIRVCPTELEDPTFQTSADRKALTGRAGMMTLRSWAWRVGTQLFLPHWPGSKSKTLPTCLAASLENRYF